MIDLVAKLRLKDDFTKPLQRATKSMNDTAKKTEGLSKSVNKMSGSFRDAEGKIRNTNGQLAKTKSNVNGLSGGFKGLAGGLGGLVTRLNPVALGFGAIATAAAGAYGAVKIFEATVGKAMEYQMSEVSISAMFETQDATDAYLKMMKQMALESPVLSYSDMTGSSKKLLTLTRDAELLENTWKNVEKLQAYMPEKSTEEALRGIAELASGDTVSLRDVFNLDKAQLNELKDLTFAEQVAGLEKMLNGMKMTDEFIEKIGNTASAKWNQVSEKFEEILASIGKPSLEVITTFFDDVLSRLEGPDMQKFADWGANVIKGMLQGLTESAIALYDWFTALQNDPEFQKRTTIAGKIQFFMEDIASRMREWYDGGGKQQIEDFGKKIAETLVAIINNSQPFFDLGIKLGGALAQGMMEGIWEGTKANFGLDSASERDARIEVEGKKNNLTPQQVEVMKYMETPILTKMFGLNSHYAGLDNVPYDGYAASLHKGERVLTAQENKALENGKLGGGNPITITGNNFTIREEADIKKVAYELAGYIEREALQIG